MDFIIEGSGGGADATSKQIATATNDAALASGSGETYYWNASDSSSAPAPATASTTTAFEGFQPQSFQLGVSATGTTAATSTTSNTNSSVQQPQQLYSLGGIEPYSVQRGEQQTQQVPQQPGQQQQQQQYVQQQPHQTQQQQQPQTAASTPAALPVAPAQQPAASYQATTAAPGAAAAPPPGTRTVVQQMPDGSYAILGHATAAGVPPQQFPATTTPGGGVVLSSGTTIIPPAAAAAATGSAAVPLMPPPYLDTTKQTLSSKPKKMPRKPIPENLTPEERQRYERNLREQQRSFQISQQIKELRSVLLAANIPLNSNKYSILLAAGEYIKQLQARAIMNEAEHRKLVNTLQQTNEYVQNPGLLSEPKEEPAESNKEEMKLFVQGLDYKAVVNQCSAALGVAALDGRFLECNSEFEQISGYSREQLKSQTLFNLLQNQQEVFEALGEMLKSTAAATTPKEQPSPVDANNIATPDVESANEEAKTSQPPMYWSGLVSGRSNPDLLMNITLARTPDGKPRFFNCALTAST